MTAVADTGYHFVSWSDGVLTAARTDAGAANLTVTATLRDQHLHADLHRRAPAARSSGTTPQTVNHGSSGTAVTAQPATGYHFVSWSDGVTTATRTDTNVTANKSVTRHVRDQTPTR